MCNYQRNGRLPPNSTKRPLLRNSIVQSSSKRFKLISRKSSKSQPQNQNNISLNESSIENETKDIEQGINSV